MKLKKTILIICFLATVASLFSLGFYLSKKGDAWVAPTQHPPGGNIPLKPDTACWLCHDQSITPPQNPASQALSLTSTRVSWTAVPGTHSYKVSVGMLEVGPFTEVDVVVHPTGFLDVTDLTEQGEYYFAIQASNDGSTWSNYSVPIYVQMPTTPGAPTGLTTSIYSETALDLSWTAPASNGGASITGYKIERQTSGGSWSTIVASTGNSTTTYRNTGLTENTQYGYRVSTVTVAPSDPTLASTKYTGHCYTTTSDCDSGYTSILGGEQSGCATTGPVSSPYPGSGNNRYRILSNGQTLTTTCSAVGTEQRTRQSQLSVDSGANYSFTGSTVNCQQATRTTGCAFNCSHWYIRACGASNEICCSSSCFGCCTTTYSGCACCSWGGAANMWNRTTTNQSATIRWCCRN